MNFLEGGFKMSTRIRKVVEAVIEDGQLKHVDKKLPDGKIRVLLIYDVDEENLPKSEVLRIVRETSGIYKNIDGETESKILRESWERNVHH